MFPRVVLQNNLQLTIGSSRTEALPEGRFYVANVDKNAMRNRLLEERALIVDRMERTGEYGLDDPMSDELSELSLYDNHPADIGSELFERGKDVALRDNDKLMLQEIDGALKAIDDGVYGICKSCGRSIDNERLEARPSVTLCVDCKEEDERLHPDRLRPIEEEFLYPGFGRTDMDDTSVTAFDGEDSWQAVERFNRRSGYIHMYEESGFEEHVGIVDDVDQISNEEYKNQLP